ncbi:11690_t:CDS:2, partial [Dentiscutata heterogama]
MSQQKINILIGATGSVAKSLTKELGVEVTTDADEWKAWSKMSDPVLHIEVNING